MKGAAWRTLVEEGTAPAEELTRLMLVGGGTTAEILHASQQLQAWLEKARAALAAPDSKEKPAKAGPSERGVKFAAWFRTLLPPGAALAASWEAKWARCFDEMLRLDARTPEQIAAVCSWAREHDFWRQNFLTPLKLRQRDAAGVMYFDRFAEGMKQAQVRGRRLKPQSRGYELAATAKTQVWDPMKP